MTKEAPVLDGLRIASPCTVSWESMKGDERVRHCGACRLNVYNLSSMTRREAEDVVRRAEGRLCVRFFRRADGTLLTRDCPVGLRAVRRRLARMASAVAAAFLGFLAAGCGRNAGPADGGPRPPTGLVAPPPEVMGRVTVAPPEMGDVLEPPALQGEVSVPPDSPR